MKSIYIFVISNCLFIVTTITAMAQPGSIDTTFSSDGKVTTDFGGYNDRCYSVAIQSDGKILVAGTIETAIGSDFGLLRYNSDGSLDSTFSSDGKVTTPIGSNINGGHSVAIQSDGKILVAGYSYNGANYDFALVRYNSDSSLDSTFSSDGKVTTPVGSSDDFGYSVSIQGDGKILIAGYSNNGVNDDFTLVRYNINGSLDSTFDSDGKVTTAVSSSYDNCFSVAIQSDGKILAAGGIASNPTTGDFALVRYNGNGSLDTTFDSDGIVTTPVGSLNERGYSVAIQSDGKILVAGKSNNGTGQNFALVRYNSNGSLDTTFDSDGKVTAPFLCSIEVANMQVAIQSDGRILMAGSKKSGTAYQFALVRYLSDGSLDSAFASDGIVTTIFGNYTDHGTSSAIQSDGKILVAGFSYNGANYDFALVRYNVACSPINFSQSPTICNGQTITVGNNTYTVNGTYTDTLTTVNGCDSVVTTDLTVLTNNNFTQNPTICNGQSVTVGNNTYTVNGTYMDTLTAFNGCDSVVTTDLTVLANSNFSQSPTICNGQSVIVGSNTYTVSGTFLDTLTATNGCDSIITTLLTVEDTVKITNNASICNGDSFSVGANIYTISGTYIDLFIALNGCDSIVTTNLTVLSNSSFTQSLIICNGQSVIVGSNTYTVSGTFLDTLTATNGCDSIITTLLTVEDTIKITNNVSICNGDSFSVGANIYTISGTYIDPFIALNGCDSIITTTLNVKQNSSFSQSVSISSGQSLTVGTHTYTTSDTNGTYTDTLIAATANGCDSIITTNLTILTEIKEVNSNIGQWIVNVYPNPFNNNVELKIQNGELELKNVELNIINPVGKIIFMKTLNSNHEILNLDLPSGTYFIRLTQDNKIITTDKLVITN